MRISDWSSDVCSSDLAKALPKHAPVRLAYEAGAEFREIRVGYNPALQKEADRLAEQPGWFKVGYGVTTEPDASPEEVRAFLEVDAPQVRSEEHTSELQSLMRISYAVFCLKKKKK